MKLTQKVYEALNAQMVMEYEASGIYLQMGAWADSQDLSGCAAFLFEHTEEERMHGRKIFDYLLEREAMPVMKSLPEPKSDYTNVKELFESVYMHECKVTASIEALAHLAWEEKDLTTFSFLQWYIDEQREEEALTSAIVGKVNIIGIEGSSLYLFDEFVGSNVSGQK